MIENNPYFCQNIVDGLYIEKVSSGQVRLSACCINARSQERDTIDFVNDPHLSTQRQQMLAQQPIPGCSECYTAELENQYSLRIGANSRWFNEPDQNNIVLKSLDFNVDPICNAKCIQCSSYYSSAWLAEDQRHGAAKIPVRTMGGTRYNDAIQTLDLSTVRKIYFNGGEPMLSNDPRNILQRLDSQGQLTNLILQFNTNGSIAPDEEIIKLWKKCAHVTVIFSIDGTGDAFEYIRNPLKWDQVQRVIRQFSELGIKGFSINFGYTAGIHNVDIIESTYQWYLEISRQWNFSHDFTVNPCHGIFDINNAPQRLKQYWLAELDKQPSRSWTNFLRSRFSSPTLFEGWMQRLAQIDQRRNLNWQNSLPELALACKKSLA